MQVSKARYLGWAAIDLAAIRQRQERPLALWYLSTYVDTKGQGIVPQPVGNSTLRRSMRQGDPLFWTRSKGRLHLRSLPAVAKGLGLPKLTGEYLAPLDWLHDPNRRRVKARLALHALKILRDGRPVSVKHAADTCGVSERTFQAWMTLTGWKRLANFCLVARLKDPDGVLALARKYGGERLRKRRIKGETWLVEQLPNSLGSYPKQQKVNRPVRRGRVNRSLRRPVISGRGQRSTRYFIPAPGQPLPKKPYTFIRIQTSPAQILWQRATTPEIQGAENEQGGVR